MKKPLIIILAIIALVLILQKSQLIIYILDAKTEKITVHSKVSVLKILPVDKKLNHLASELSRIMFQGRKIVLTGIKREENKEIAYFDLQDGDKNLSSDKNWYNFLQGSSGANNTKTTIIETLLQRKYKGDWIEGIKLSYNGQFIEMDHIVFEDEIHWRNEK